MPKMIVSIDGVVIKEVQLTKDRTTLGRRPYNDIVIDNLAVSGEHATLQMSGNEVHVEDLNSTNGTYVNGKAIKKQLLQNGDTVEVGKYKVKYVNEAASAGFEKTMVIKAGAAGLAPPAAANPGAVAAPVVDAASLNGRIKVLSGAAAGREVGLVKVVTTIGKQLPSATMVLSWHTSKARTSLSSMANPLVPIRSCSKMAICWNWPARKCSTCRGECDARVALKHFPGFHATFG
jgi:hypothetical protein